ncbi:MAG: hypothetical protein H6682_22435 [Candidatus Eisenbacteria bacterium]|nr:hypothetical protein [Candidatus Eisenbacteria bacterium]
MLRFSDLNRSRLGLLRLGLLRLGFLCPGFLRLGFLFAFLALPQQSSAERLTNADVTIVSFGSVNGEVTDCGCRAHPKGGLDIRSGYVDWLREEKVPFLHVDLGNFIGVKESTRDLLTHFLWDAMEEMGVDAVTPGPRELEQWELFTELRTDSPIRVVSSNVFVSHDGIETPVGEESIVIERNGVKIGLFGLMGTQRIASANAADGTSFRIEEPTIVAEAVVPKLREVADVVVLLSEMPSAETTVLLGRVPGIDVALCGYLPRWQEEAEKRNDTVVQETGSRGQYVGSLMLIVDPDGNIVDFGSRNAMAWDPFPRDGDMHERVASVLAEAEEIEERSRAARTPGVSPVGGGGE